MQNPFGLRSFKGGAWDLRKVDRRKEQLYVRFPDRRVENRRLVGAQDTERATSSNLVWLSLSGRDE
ncbi:MAG TPA: hypothetical protein VK465_14895 [Fibrobacteria bacterium]|nr:hypothetical protein [Fibrobacteria bacterium]